MGEGEARVKISTALRLGRVSNLPTVTSNALAATALAGARPNVVTIAIACGALSLMYVAGMFLNDAFDRDHDRVHRPERPIPSGEIDAASVFASGFGLLLAGIAGVGFAAVATGAGWKPVASVLALALLIVFYDANHKANRLAPLVMGMCRACVYTTTALLVGELSSDVVAGSAVLTAYLVGLTCVAKQENLTQLPNLWPLALLAAPFVVARPHGTLAIAIYAVFAAAVVRAVWLVRSRRIKPAVTGLIAGISLYDALACANHGRGGLAAVAVAAWVVTIAFQRVVPGT
jgi:4-hydroxybenzoate polyprenyltransferase